MLTYHHNFHVQFTLSSTTGYGPLDGGKCLLFQEVDVMKIKCIKKNLQNEA